MREFDEFLAAVSFDGIARERGLHHGVLQDQIAAALTGHGADLLVMGATGRTGIGRVLLVSVTRRVLRELPCSLPLVIDQTVFEAQYLLDLDVIARLTAEGRDNLRAGQAAGT